MYVLHLGQKRYRLTTISHLRLAWGGGQAITVWFIKDFLSWGPDRAESRASLPSGKACPVLLLGEEKRLCYGVLD